MGPLKGGEADFEFVRLPT